MTNYQHPITVPPELVQEWVDMLGSRSDQDVFTLVADWGSDRELQACCAQISQCHLLTINQSATIARYLHSCRRPKPPSLKEQVSKALDRVPGPGADSAYLRQWSKAEAASLINDVRRALEQLDD
jgi:hypothetical protein